MENRINEIVFTEIETKRTVSGKCKLLTTLALLSLITFNSPAYADYEGVCDIVLADAQGKNTITKYVWDNNSQTLKSQYYNFELNKAEFGSGDNVKYYEFVEENNKSVLKEVLDSNDALFSVRYGDNSGRIVNKKSGQDISGDFVGNVVTGNGAAIFNNGNKLGNVSGLFLENYSKNGWGSAIYGGTIDSVNGIFINNTTSYGDFHGGSIANATINDLKGAFIGNWSEGYSAGSAILQGVIYNIEADFIGNSAEIGAGICNTSVGYVKGNFIGNSAGHSAGALRVWQIDEDGVKLESNFIGNHSKGLGGAIVNEGAHIKFIKGDFIGNYVKTDISNVGDAYKYVSYNWGGAIANDRCGNDPIDLIIGDFHHNYVESVESPSYGGAIANFYDDGGYIGVVNGDFLGNYVKSENGSAHAGAYAGIDDSWIHELNSNFYQNYVISGVQASGGAIYNKDALIGEINGDMIKNSATSKNSNAYGGAIYNEGKIGGAYTNLSKETAQGAFRGSIIGNYAKTNSADKLALGGGIFTNSDIILEADAQTNLIKDNYTEDSRGKLSSGIFVRTNKAKLNSAGNGYDYEVVKPNVTFNTKNGGIFVINDKIEGGDLKGTLYKGKLENFEEVTLDGITYENKYDLSLTGDSTGAIYLNNDIVNANITLDNTNLYLSRENILNNSNLNLNAGSISMVNNMVGISSLQNLTLTGNTNLNVDVDLANQKMDRFKADTYGNHTGNIIVTGMNLISDNPTADLAIYFAEKGLKNNVVNAVDTLPGSQQKEVYSPIYRYTVAYDNRNDGGYFVFNQSGLNSSNPSFKYNPAVIATPAAAEAGGQSVVSETVRFAFQHADMFSQMPYVERMAYINQNKYAITEGNVKYTHDFDELNKGAWVKPFTSFEKISLHNGPDVDAITYGTIIGFDSNFNELKHGWYNVHSAYVGYNGSSLNYHNVDTTLNGGLLGLTETFYKGNFFTALTATAGASVGENNTMYGNEHYTMLLGGLGSKTGYDFEFKNGKYIIQPILFMNYSFVNTFDYTNAAGVKLENSPFHTLQVNPSIKATANFKNGWQPYASVGFVWNVLNSGKVRANNVVLPNMSVDPYVEYGVGIQKSWKDRFTGYGQAMVRNGGRNGVALTFGFRWAIGRDAESL